ncbi:MAG: riboflavin synthase [Bacteroidales bacterium]|nr:riboflavin synthase [Bacteroidales bacterium]
MFTGLIEEIGKISKIAKGINSYQFSIEAKKILSDIKLGDSVATNGACLTVIGRTNSNFTVDIMAETVKLTNFSKIKLGDSVNLERAMRLSDRLGGHLVSGHIDGIGKIGNIKKEDIATIISIEAPKELLNQMLNKGSIAIDGISLTIINVGDTEFQVSIIPHTSQETTLFKKRISDFVNLETDMIGKYIMRFLNIDKKENLTQAKPSKVNMDFLAENGYL